MPSADTNPATPSTRPVADWADQEVFDRVAVHLVTQKARSTDSSLGCAYRGEGGLMCAVGCLVPDGVYNPSIEGEVVTALEMKSSRVAAWLGVSSDDDDKYRVHLLMALQGIHDEYDPTQWPHRLGALADRLHLSTSALDAALASNQAGV